jgi:hypothetical protein
MAATLEIVKPTTVGGIEFYVSNLSGESGISQSGIARLCGLTETTIRLLINGLGDRSVSHERMRHPALALILGMDLTLDITSGNQAKVIKDEYAADIIAYYASRGNKTAHISLKKFQVIGIRTWIKEITGHSTGNDLVLVQKSLNQILDVLTTTNARLSNLEEQTRGYTRASIEMPGLKDWMDRYAEEDPEQLVLPDRELFTLSEYLWTQKQLRFEKPAMSLFSLKVSYVFKTMSEKKPGRKRGQGKNGYQTPLTNAYSRSDFPLLDIAFKQTVLEI